MNAADRVSAAGARSRSLVGASGREIRFFSSWLEYAARTLILFRHFVIEFFVQKLFQQFFNFVDGNAGM
jgi:hypothetical protein